jgi:hypothetical protein
VFNIPQQLIPRSMRFHEQPAEQRAKHKFSPLLNAFFFKKNSSVIN